MDAVVYNLDLIVYNLDLIQSTLKIFVIVIALNMFVSIFKN